jgi:hypothetical protein
MNHSPVRVCARRGYNAGNLSPAVTAEGTPPQSSDTPAAMLQPARCNWEIVRDGGTTPQPDPPWRSSEIGRELMLPLRQSPRSLSPALAGAGFEITDVMQSRRGAAVGWALAGGSPDRLSDS